jgi:exodeoxyribonuclease VIII
MRDAVMANKDAAELLTGHEAETSLRWDADDVPVKARLDAWHRDAQKIVDLKTTRDASPRGFGRAAAEYGYHAQAAHYADGVRALTGQGHEYYIVCVEKTEPYLTAVYEVFPDMLDAGRETVREGLAAYREAKAANHWPTSYPTQPLDLPAWAYPELELNL